MTVVHFKIRRDSSGCWEWQGATERGYGRVWDSSGQNTARAHRVLWTELVGPIPDDMTIDHLCHNRACVNPNHLELVSFEENMRRAVAFKHSGADVCQSDHPMTPENTMNDGRCRCCRRTYLRDWNRRARQAVTS